jgi:hypothetical protein
MRKQWHRILKRHRDVTCPRVFCVYNEDGKCDEPYINYGNGDAECHDMSYKDVVTMLEVGDECEVKGNDSE